MKTPFSGIDLVETNSSVLRLTDVALTLKGKHVAMDGTETVVTLEVPNLDFSGDYNGACILVEEPEEYPFTSVPVTKSPFYRLLIDAEMRLFTGEDGSRYAYRLKQK